MDILLKSLASAVITALILILARFAGPRLAGALGGIPIIFATSYILVTSSDKSLSRDFLIGGIYGALAGIFFSAVLIFLNAQFLKTHWVNFAVAYALCFLFALGLTYFSSK